ncbi:MAG: metallophosphatase family protein [Candidatus Marinimicrobia bacterium]|nr:metallophosphatase family protein [Candidatus Neomarinimicrobiota bacterium]
MRIAVISDVHGNLEAFRTVLEDIKKKNIDRIYNLGDFVDYGADSEEVARIIMESDMESIIGNHEYPFIDATEINLFSPNALQSFRITKTSLSDEVISWIKQLPKVKIYNNCRFVHGLPPDSVNKYLTYQSKYELMNRFRQMEEQIAFIGHTHIQKVVKYNKKEMSISIVSLHNKPLNLSNEFKYIVNVGSIGQPRSSNKQAKYVIYDKNKNLLEGIFLDYDIDTAVEKIQKAGYPDFNARILKPGE